MEFRDLLIDLGTYESLIGKAGADSFELIEPSIYADSNNPILKKFPTMSLSEMAKERFYGQNALKFKNTLKIEYFLKSNDFISLSAFLQQVLERMYLDPNDYGLILLVPSTFTPIQKQRLQNVLFQSLNFPRISFLPHSLCGLSGLGLTTGVIVDIGFYSTRIESIFKGFPHPEGVFEYPIGGFHITQQLIDKIFANQKYKSLLPLTWVVEDIKRATVKIVPNLNQILQEIQEGSTSYDVPLELPDGKQLIINRERFESAEVLFKPEIAFIRSEGLINVIEKSIRVWERAQVPEFLKNIIICGGTARIPGLLPRIESQLKERFGGNLDVKVLPLSDYKSLFWVGGSILYTKKQGELEWIQRPIETEDDK